MQCLSPLGQPGGNSSSRESKLPRVRPRAGNGRSTPARGGGRKEAPDARRGRWPRPEQVVRRRRSRPQGCNFPAAWRANGAEKAREAGREGAVRGCRYRVRRSAASRLGLCSPPGRPPRAACSAAGHRRVSPPARRLTLGTPAAPASPWARRWPPATSGAPRARTRRTPNVPRLCTPALHARGRAAPPRPAQRPAAVGRVLSPSIAPRSPRPSLPSRRRRSSPRSTFPRFLRPARPPPPRPRLLTLPPALPPPWPPPAGPRLAAHPLHAARRDRGGPCRVPLRPPGAARSPARRSGHEYFSAGEAALCRCHGTGCCGNSTNPPPRGKEDARGSGPRCVREPCPAGPSALPERGAQRGWGPGGPPAGSAPPAEPGNAPGKPEPASRPTAWVSRRHLLALSAPSLLPESLSVVPLVPEAAWLNQLPLPTPLMALPPAPSPSLELRMSPRCLQMKDPGWEEGLEVTRTPSLVQ